MIISVTILKSPEDQLVEDQLVKGLAPCAGRPAGAMAARGRRGRAGAI